MRKHGKVNFTREILEFCEDRIELSDRECEIVSLNEISKVDCMNMRVGGTGGASKAGNDAYLYRLHNDDEFRKMITEKAKANTIRLIKEGKLKPWTKDNYYDWNGKKHSDETKKKMSEDKKGTGMGESNSQYGTCWITRNGENKKINKELLDTYIIDGWIKGKGTCWITRNGKNKKINKELLDTYIIDGWVKGITKKIKNGMGN